MPNPVLARHESTRQVGLRLSAAVPGNYDTGVRREEPMDPSILRILDANSNRAREALRVLGEYARFVLQDTILTQRCKQCRHDLAEALKQIPRAAMLANRDVECDVGTRISTPSERVRADPEAVAAAGAKRAVEALRCLEEYSKIASPESARAFESMRYRVYSIEQDIFVLNPRLAKLRAARLHVLITESICKGAWWKVAEQAIAGGADVLQLREKSLADHKLMERARQLRKLTNDHDVLFFVNDRPDIVCLADADGVHVGRDDLSVSDARKIVGRARLVGTSTHSVEQAGQALSEGPDYLAVGPMFATPTKPNSPVQGPKLLSGVLEIADRPIVAIGGITSQNVGSLDLSESVQIAVCSGVIAAADVLGAARAIAAAVRASRPQSVGG